MLSCSQWFIHLMFRGEDAGEADVLWLASTGVSGTPDKQKLSRLVVKSLNLSCFL